MSQAQTKHNTMLQKAQACFDSRNLQQAEAICNELLKVNKNDSRVHFLLYRVAAQQQRAADAVKHAKRAIDCMPRHVPYRMALGIFLAGQGQYEDSVVVFKKALTKAPHNMHVIAALADSLEMMGQPQQGHELLEPIMKSGKDDVLVAMPWARIAIDLKQPEEAIRALTRHAGAASASGRFHYLLGEAYEKLGDVDKSFEAYAQANAAVHVGFNLDEHIETHRKLCQVFSNAMIKKLPRPSHDTSLPIFIAGRPRSGTTLTEKILDAHPGVAGVGELPMLGTQIDGMNLAIGSTLPYPECVLDLDQDGVNLMSQEYLDHVRRLAPGLDVRRVVDKNLANYERLGLISVLFPQSRVLHIRRNAIDNCWACFTVGLNVGWTMNLRTLGITYRIYERLMQFWHEALDLPILDIDYESVVDDQEGWTRKILDFCGLEFDERCLRFYESARDVTTNKIAGQTLSYNQVRQPIYKSSVNRAAKFEKHLGPLRDALEEGKQIAETIVKGSVVKAAHRKRDGKNFRGHIR